MDKIQDKANKLLDDVRKKKIKRTKNVNKDSTKISTGQIENLVPFKCCIYCQKVFCNSKYLMKHLLRRHSDELILIYKNFADRDLTDILKKEFSSLKEFFSAKLTEDGKREAEGDQSSEVKEATCASERNENSSCNILSNDIRDLKEQILDIKQYIHKSDDKFTNIENVLKNEVLLKQDVDEKLAISEEKIMKSQESQIFELRKFFLSELKSLLHNQQEEISNECKLQLSNLREKIGMLETVLNANQQLICAESLKEEIKKELMPHIIPHIHNRKRERKQLEHSLSKTELSVGKSHLTSPLQISSHENFACDESKSKRFKRHLENTSEINVDLTSVVTEKLSQFSIAPNITKLSDADFNNKEKLLSIEKERLSKKHGNFHKIYDELNVIADRKTYNKLKTKKHKIKFADPLISSKNDSNHLSFEDGIYKSSVVLENRNKQSNSKEKLNPSDSRFVSENKAHSSCESTNFPFNDKGASGDSAPFSNKQNIPIKRTKLSSIKEYEISNSLEDVQNSKNLSITSSKKSTTSIAAQSKYKKQSDDISPLPIGKRELKTSTNNHFVEFKHHSSFISPNKGDNCDSVHMFSSKQNNSVKHAKSSSFKRFETSSPVEDIQNTKSLKFSKSNTTVTAKQSGFKDRLSCISPNGHRKLNSPLNGHSTHIKETEKMSNKLSELEDYSKSDEDFDDVSSLETYNSSNSDEHC